MSGRMQRKGETLALLIGMQTGAATLENSKKLKIELPYDPAIALLGIYPKVKKNTDSKGHVHPNIYSSIINNSQIMQRAKCSSTDEWIKMWYEYIQWDITQPSKRMKSCHLQ